MDRLLERRQAVDDLQPILASAFAAAALYDKGYAHSLAPSEVCTPADEPSEDELLLDPRRARRRPVEEINEVATLAVDNVDETILLGPSEVVDSLQVRSTASIVIPAAAAGNDGGGDGNEEESNGGVRGRLGGVYKEKEKGKEASRENSGVFILDTSLSGKKQGANFFSIAAQATKNTRAIECSDDQKEGQYQNAKWAK
jgi:hypothetical protein